MTWNPEKVQMIPKLKKKMSLYSELNGYKFCNPDKDISYIEDLNKNQKKIDIMIGILAANIRCDWSSGVGDRLDSIIELSEQLGKHEWIKQIKDNEDEIYEDGRWMRDVGMDPIMTKYALVKM